MITWTRLHPDALSAWVDRRRSPIPPLIVSLDVPAGEVHACLRSYDAEAFVVDATGSHAAGLEGRNTAYLPGPESLDLVLPFLSEAETAEGVLDVVVLDAAPVPTDTVLTRLAGFPSRRSRPCRVHDLRPGERRTLRPAS